MVRTRRKLRCRWCDREYAFLYSDKPKEDPIKEGIRKGWIEISKTWWSDIDWERKRFTCSKCI